MKSKYLSLPMHFMSSSHSLSSHLPSLSHGDFADLCHVVSAISVRSFQPDQSPELRIGAQNKSIQGLSGSPALNLGLDKFRDSNFYKVCLFCFSNENKHLIKFVNFCCPAL